MTGSDMRDPKLRRPGRPRSVISMEEVARAAAQLFSQGGYSAVSIEAVAERLSVSRATLYRTVSTKEDLLGIVLERYTTDLGERARQIIEADRDPRATLEGLLRIQVDAAITTKEFLTVVAGGTGVQSDSYRRWQKWSHEYESMWQGVVARAIDAGVLAEADPVVTTRLLLGMAIWVSRWYRDSEGHSADEIADVAVRLILAPH
ncbi:transcriptional regulator, TetR family [Parafrankia sp. EUN1f]|nr:transcriptional regulator, TetR family [Parafrankia sp. EUN1f]